MRRLCPIKDVIAGWETGWYIFALGAGAVWGPPSRNAARFWEGTICKAGRLCATEEA